MDQTARTSKQLGTALRRQRKLRGLTQSELGAQINRRQATISNLESAEGGTTLETLFGVLAALDLEIVVRARTKSTTAELEDIF